MPPHNEPADLKALHSHFAFGKNWGEYSRLIDRVRIDQAKSGMLALIPRDELAGKRFLDIGGGSGLHAFAALELGVRSATVIDLDPDSVRTAAAVLQEHCAAGRCEVRQLSVFDLPAAGLGEFDVVYSWGVLHHTGALAEAIRAAATAVSPGGLLAFALYRRTRLCGPWTRLKRWYARASTSNQTRARTVYTTLMRLKFILQGRSFQAYLDEYKNARGMDYHHDVHDWMGGYPYESVTEAEVDAMMGPLGFIPVRRVVGPLRIGLFGSGCDEYVFRRGM